MPFEPRDRRDRLIVALDVPGLPEAEALLDRLAGVVSTFKVGAQLFTAAGPAAVELVRKRGGRVFLDLKYHDIPAQVAGAVGEAARLGVSMLTVHAAGGREMLRAAAGAAAGAGRDRPRVLAVTVLTSLDRAALQRDLQVPLAVEGHVVHLAGLAREAGCDGAVASPQEARRLRATMGPDWLIVTPGIRPAGAEAGDQARVATAAAARKAGADYVVVGRPITGAPDPLRAAEAILQELGA
ncbi:MAG TPA: orotidine-5'-phosphate decarboxylase [Methylomirabilota bacterium]|jgi:orotidine-5'-phosphate decarboxylase|nr:orotidine-5'-phosphate decarboxylase [Methylomirabilota bacterium]